MDRRTVLAVSLSFILLMAYQTYMDMYYPPIEVHEAIESESKNPQDPKLASDVAGIRVGKGKAGPVIEVAENPTIKFLNPASQTDTGRLIPFQNQLTRGNISQTGAQIVDLEFLKHLDELPPDGDPIHYLQRKGAELFFGESGFLATPDIKTPNRKTVWTIQGESTLDKGGSVVLVWDNGSDLLFEKTITFQQESYLFNIKDRVINQSPKQSSLYHFAQLVRTQPEEEEGQAMAIADYQGPMGYLDGIRVQHSYEDILAKDQHQDASSGWAGFSDKFFLAALIPQDTKGKKKFYFDNDLPTFRVGLVSAKLTLEAGSEASFTSQLFIGPKEIRNLEAQGLALERAIDYGWFHFLAVPLVKMLLFFNDFFHNYGVAIIFLTIAIKMLFYPLANKSYKSMNAMKKLQPKIEELKKLYGKDKVQLNQEMMKLYQTHKVNPLGGCLPIVIQIPVFFALYKVLFLSIEMRHADFFLWINDLSIKDPFYVLPVLMGISMFYQSKLNPAPADPTQAKIMMFLPVIFTVMFLTFPAGLVLYWLINNVLSIAQQTYIKNKDE